MSTITMSWNDRFALIEHFKPSDAQVLAAFGLTQDELDTARQLKAAGTFQASKNMDMAQYSTVFSSAQLNGPAVTASTAQASSPSKPVETQTSTITSRPLLRQSTATSYARPETATKKVKEPQKRGRKGDRIATALASVPTTQVSAEQFSKEHNVSIAVLRQAKRFLSQMPAEQQAQIGTVCVRQDKATKQLMIWREVATAE